MTVAESLSPRGACAAPVAGCSQPRLSLVAHSPLRVVVCEPASLTAHAIAAVLRRPPMRAETAVTASTDHALSKLRRWGQILVLPARLGPELPDLVQALAFHGVSIPVLMTGTAVDAAMVARHVEWGAVGSVDLDRPVSSLLASVRAAADGVPVVDGAIRDEVVENLERRHRQRAHARLVLRSLSLRERQVTRYLADGTNVLAIARELYLSPHTVRSCIQTLGPKLGATGQLEIAAIGRLLLDIADRPATSRDFCDRWLPATPASSRQTS